MTATEDLQATEEVRPSALDRALPVLKHLARYPRGINLDALSFQLEMPKSTLHRALAALSRAGFVEHDDRGEYRLGIEFLRVAFEFHDARDEQVTIQPALEALVRQFGESAVFGRRDGADVVYLASVPPPVERFTIAAKVGARVALHATALGKVILAYEADRQQVLDDLFRASDPLASRTTSTIRTRDAVAAELDHVRAQGFALELQENDLGVEGIAFPVFLDDPRRLTGAIALLTAAVRTPASTLAIQADAIRSVIEQELGPVTRGRAQDPEPLPTGADRGAVSGARDPRPASAPARAVAAPVRTRAARDHAARIESVETIAVDAGRCSYRFVRVHTREGLVGVGEATLEWQDDMVAAAIRQLGRQIIGINADRIEHIWQMLQRGGFWRGGPVMVSAISGIEQALWDLKGKALGVPVYELLGGACRDHIPVYANGPRGTTPDEFAASAVAIVARGFRAMKFAAVDPHLPVDTAASLDRVVAIVAAVRDAVGPDVAIAIDVHGRMSPAMSIRLARAIERYDIWFLEEPALPDNPAGLRMVADATSIPIAAGERLATRGEYRDLFEQRAVALVQPDIAHCGGIAEARRIAAMAEAYQIGFAPHNPLSPVNTVASAHVGMATPNLVSMELLVDDVPWRDAILREPLRVEEGRLFLSDAPGLGIELDLETCRAHPPTSTAPPAFRHADGAVAEW